MSHISLPNPLPRPRPGRSEKYQYRILSTSYLRIPQTVRDQRFFDSLSQRRTRRRFGDLSDRSVGELLWYSAKTVGTQRLANGRQVQFRCCPSAGGVHPIDVLLLDTKTTQIALYDPVGHAFHKLRGPARQLRHLQHLARKIVDFGGGRIFWFAAEFNRTLDLYKHGESLVWRDTGALIATFCYVSEALGLSCCPIGATGEPFISQFLCSKRAVVGVGGCVVGRRVP